MNMKAVVPPISCRSIAHGVSVAGFWILLAAQSFAGQPTFRSQFRDPAELIRKAVQNEIRAANDNTAHVLFRGTKTTPKGSTTRIYVETTEATAGLVIAYNGKNLAPEQRRDEEARVERLVNNPEELRKKREQERETADHTMRIVRALPDSFLFEYAGEVAGSDDMGRAGDNLVKLNFQPNPRYEPPSHVEEVLTGMQGFILVDVVHYRLACIDGTLFKEVGFGWGILGHLDRGGRFIVQQRDVGDDLWEISNMTLNFTGKVLIFKNLAISSTEVFSDFRRVPPDLTFSQALEMLKKEDPTISAN
jgi:hypothetical protein